MPLWPSPFSKAGFWDGVSNTARGPGVEHACLPNRSQRRERRRSDSGCGAQFLFHPNNSGGKTPRWIADASSCLGRCWVVSQTRADGSGVPRGERFFFFRTRGCAKCKRFVPFLHAAEILPVAFRLFNLRFFKQNKTAKHKRQRFRVQADKKKKK